MTSSETRKLQDSECGLSGPRQKEKMNRVQSRVVLDQLPSTVGEYGRPWMPDSTQDCKCPGKMRDGNVPCRLCLPIMNCADQPRGRLLNGHKAVSRELEGGGYKGQIRPCVGGWGWGVGMRNVE